MDCDKQASMKKIFISLVILAFLHGSPSSFAAPRSIASVTRNHVERLDEMHRQAAEFLTVNDFHSALRVYTDIILMEPDDETAYEGLGQIHLIQGQTKKAREAFENALQINPDNEVAAAGIKKILDPDGAEDMTSRTEIARETPLPEKPAAVKKVPRTLSGMRLGKLYVQRFQMALRIAGAYDGPIDGLLNKKTRQSIRNFQMDHGLENTGSVNAATWDSLSLYLSHDR